MTSRHIMAGIVLLLLGAAAGWLFAQAGGTHSPMSHGDNDGPCADGAQPTHWAAPMDPGYQRNEPGKSPMGMDLVPVCAGADASAAADVTIDPQVVQNLGVRTAAVERRALSKAVSAVGVVAYDENSFQMIHARAEGWLEELSVESEGSAVQAGERLYALFSPKLVAAEQEYLTARRSQRAPLIQAAAERLSALGYNADQIDALRRRGEPASQLLRRADTDAVVSMLGVRDGQFVSPGTHMLTLASLDTVWVLVDVMERDAALVHQGLSVSVRFPSWPGRTWRGQVDYVYPSLDSTTRTLKVRVVLENPDGALRPNMFARATIHSDALSDVLSVPAAAVIRDGDGDRVVRRLNHGAFDVVPVRTGLRAGDWLQVFDGLSAGDEVVVSGQFLIDSEANLDAEALRLKAEHPRGRTRGEVTQLDTARGTITLKHETIEPLGQRGISMPGMTMSFELGAEGSDVRLGDQVEVIITQPAAGRYRVIQMRALPGQNDSVHLTAGQVVEIDRQHRRITLKHEAIESVGMAAMTMPFPLAPTIDIDTLRPGDEVRFALIDGSMTIGRLEAAP